MWVTQLHMRNDQNIDASTRTASDLWFRTESPGPKSRFTLVLCVWWWCQRTFGGCFPAGVLDRWLVGVCMVVCFCSGMQNTPGDRVVPGGVL